MDINIVMEQEQIKEDSISLVSIYTDDYAVEKRRLSNAKFKVYKCICNRKHHSQVQMRSHKLKCSRRRIEKRKRQKMEQYEHSLLANTLNSQTSPPNSIDVQEFNDFKNRVLALESLKNHQAQLPTFDAHRRAKFMLDKYSQSIYGIILNKVAVSLENAVQANIKISDIENSIAASIMCKLQSLSFDDCVQPLSQKLLRAHHLLSEQSHRKSQKTRNYNERAFNFLSLFSQFELLTQIKVFDQMLTLEKTQRKSVQRYFSKIRRIDPYFSKYPPLPKMYQSIPKGVMLSATTIEEAARTIRQIYSESYQELACDMWLVVCLGLRFHDIMKIYFMVDNAPVKFIRLLQRKTGNLCQRYIPKSLIEMVVASGTAYPASENRIRRAVRECLQRFNSSYGFKHRALTAKLTALHKSSPLARMHSRPQMTMNHYINKNDERLIDEAFYVGINFIFTPEVTKMISDRNLCLDLSGNVPKLTFLSQSELGEITIPSNDIINDRVDSSIMDGVINGALIDKSLVPEPRISCFFQASIIATNHQLQLLPHTYQSIDEALANLDKENSIVLATQSLICLEGGDVDQKLIVDKLAQVTERQVHFYSFSAQEKQLAQHIVSSHEASQNTNKNVELIVSKTSEGYRVSSDDLQINRSRVASIIAKGKISQASFTHRPFAPICQNCKQNSIFSKLKSSNFGVECSKCSFKDEHIGQLYPFKPQIQIYCLNPDEIEGYPCVQLLKTKNNLIQKNNQLYPGKASTALLFSKDFPCKIKTTYRRASSYFHNQILKLQKNMQYLPLSIQQSKISNAGLGIVATKSIKANQLVMVYTGVIGTSYSIIEKEANDSLFELGWISTQQKKGKRMFQVLIDGRQLIGPGRFVNSSVSKNGANLIPSSVVCNGKLTIFFCTARSIEQQQELLFFYGSKYWNKSKPQKEQLESQQDQNSEM